MTDLLMRIFQNSIIASILFFVIQWLKPVLKHYRYDMFRTLWIVLILFLLIPVDITIPKKERHNINNLFIESLFLIVSSNYILLTVAL